MQCIEGRSCFIGFVLSAIIGIMTLNCSAQQTAAGSSQQAETPEAFRARGERYIAVLKVEIERGEARVKSITENLISLDKDIESRINRIVSLLSSARDSADKANSTIRQAKEDLLAGLEATAKYYAQQRDQRKREMDNPLARIDDEGLAMDVAALNARIETRVTQSIAIVSSLTMHNEGPTGKYRDSDLQESQEWRRVERDAKASVKIKADLVAELKASIDKLTLDVKAREQTLASTTDPDKRAVLTKDIETMRKTIEERRNQVETIIAGDKTDTRPVSSQAAFEMDKMLDEMTAALKKDFMKFKSLVGERDAERATLKSMNDRLKKAQAALDALSAGTQLPADAATQK
jgi:hypothetical protein